MFKTRSIRFGGRGVASDTITNTDLANMAEGTAKGRPFGSTGDPQDLTPAQQGENARFMTVVSDTTSSGVQTAYTWAETTTQIRANTASSVEIRGIANTNTYTNGKRLIFHREPNSAGVWTFRHNTGGATTQQQLFLKDERDRILGEGCTIILEWTNNRWREIGGTCSSTIDPVMFFVDCPSGGSSGTADDVTIWNAAAPFALRILDAQLRVSTAVGGSSAALRTASGGGGSVVLPDPAAATQTFSTAATGVLEDLATATATVAAGGSLFLRRSDRSVVGELVLTCIRT